LGTVYLLHPAETFSKLHIRNIRNILGITVVIIIMPQFYHQLEEEEKKSRKRRKEEKVEVCDS